MCRGRVIVLDPELGTKILELGIIKLPSIIGHQSSWDTKLAYYGTPHKIAYFLFCDSSQRFDLSPFGEVIYCNDDEFALTLPNGQRFQYVQTPLLERLGACD